MGGLCCWHRKGLKGFFSSNLANEIRSSSMVSFDLVRECQETDTVGVIAIDTLSVTVPAIEGWLVSAALITCLRFKDRRALCSTTLKT